MSSRRILLRDIYHLVTNDPQRTRLRGVDLLIEGERIIDVGEGLPRGDAEEIDASTKLVIPGLVNTHHHMYQTLQRNIIAVQDAELFLWLVGLYPIWSHLDAEVVRVSTQLACVELLKTGCTTTADHHYVFPRAVRADLITEQLGAAAKVGIRFCATRGSMSRGQSQGGLPPDSVVQSEDQILDDCRRLAELHDPGPLALQKLALAPCSPFSVTPELMRGCAELARERGLRLHTHLAETKDEQAYCHDHYGCRPLALMERLGWLGEDVWFAHGIHFDDRELAQLARTGTGVAHCPSSNMRLGSGIARLREMLAIGVPVGLAVDGSASNDSSDMLGELRACLMLQRVLGGASAISAEQVLTVATSGGAALLGWPELGRLEVGRAADLVMIEMNRLDYAGALNDPLAAIIFCGASHGVDTTIVNGRVVVRDGRARLVDEDDLRDRANALSKKMLEAEGHDTRWNL